MQEWREEASCIDMDTGLFFEQYENDPKVAKEVDSLCHGCPVRMQCLKTGISTSSYGTFGGIYLVRGKYSKSNNNHKTKEQIAYESDLVRKLS